MTRRLVIGMLAAIITGLAVTAIVGHRPDEGPTVVTVTNTHGLHASDFLITGVWLVGMAGCGWLWRRG